MLKHIHHINFLVRDLDDAVARYRAMFGVEDWTYGELEARGVRTARFPAGETWVVLVQPVDPAGEPAQRLREQGEGCFLVSFAVDDLDTAVAAVRAGGGEMSAAGRRRGLEGWPVEDVDPAHTCGAPIQLTAG